MSDSACQILELKAMSKQLQLRVVQDADTGMLLYAREPHEVF